MKFDPGTLDETEERYLTDRGFKRWFNKPVPPVRFDHHFADSSLSRQANTAPVAPDAPMLPPVPGSIGDMVRRYLGKPVPACQPEPVRNVAEEVPEPSRTPTKGWPQTRTPTTVWTLFRSGDIVIAVNADGAVASRAINPLLHHSWTMWIEPTGTLTRRGKQATPEELANRDLKGIISRVQSDVMAWVGREKGRRAPAGIRLLIKRMAVARKIHPPLTRKEIAARNALMDESIAQAIENAF